MKRTNAKTPKVAVAVVIDLCGEAFVSVHQNEKAALESLIEDYWTDSMIYDEDRSVRTLEQLNDVLDGQFTAEIHTRSVLP